MPLNHLDRPVILGIVGDSAAGKTTLLPELQISWEEIKL